MPTVALEEVIYQLPNELIKTQRISGKLVGSTGEYEIPDAVPNSISVEDYHKYRHGKVSGCADVIAYTHTDNGPAAILTFRKEGVCFEKKWFMQGGAIDKLVPIIDFVAHCAQEESGSLPTIEALVGFFRTSEYIPGKEKQQVSSIQCAYIGYIPPDTLKLRPDAAHTDIALMTEATYAALPEDQKHWYPTLLMKILFETMP